ncbi:Acyl-CoA N-acyltransferases (NAT) superfamily protein [Rhynchospora pubera]|uniref:Acyl-CoA N-acyltransferases (NAT) superfamily protein n=1 Tax=Rhynchospora pubera TaxID=906938 RepID=A0AAV8DFD5_9POAL|nr:Acyl-CoA N-acyltransferases (NAT) superfamily protein [Rhynchospora pubera]
MGAGASPLPQPLSSLSLSSPRPGPGPGPGRLPSLSFPRNKRRQRQRHPLSLSLSPLRCSPSPQTQQQQLVEELEEPQQQTQQTQTFLSPSSLSKLQTLSSFSRTHHFPDNHKSATLLIRPMLDPEIDAVSDLLSQSFIQTLFLPPNYVKLLAFLVKNYLLGRRALLPHATVLVGIYYSADTDAQDQHAQLACTAEISFDERGANAASSTPFPPPDCPYICNMTVKDSLRRKGIGKRLLNTCEDLITEMTDKRDLYLHCRMVDEVPLSMYRKAGYQIVKTDSFLVWLTLQRRKYLMRKTLCDDVIDSETQQQASSEGSWVG